MKKILKYLSVIIVVIAVSVAVYSISSSNQTVEMQNKEALAEKPIGFYIPCLQTITTDCEITLFFPEGGTSSINYPNRTYMGN